MWKHSFHRQDHRSRLILDLDSTIITVFGPRRGGRVGYTRGIAGTSDDPLCLEANSSFLWGRANCAAAMRETWAGSEEYGLLFHSHLPTYEKCRVRARARISATGGVGDAGSASRPVTVGCAHVPSLESVCLRALRRADDTRWEIAELSTMSTVGPHARVDCGAERGSMRPIRSNLFPGALRIASGTRNLQTDPAAGVAFLRCRAGREPRIRECVRSMRLRKIPTRAFGGQRPCIGK